MLHTVLISTTKSAGGGDETFTGSKILWNNGVQTGDANPNVTLSADGQIITANTGDPETERLVVPAGQAITLHAEINQLSGGGADTFNLTVGKYNTSTGETQIIRNMEINNSYNNTLLFQTEDSAHYSVTINGQPF